MSDPPSQRDQARQQRLGAALRENLKRRKAQAKGKSAGRSASEASDASEHSRTDEADSEQE